MGRGLAGILDAPSQISAVPGSSGLTTLFGTERNRAGGHVRQYVLDAALGAIMDAFGLDGVVAAGLGRDDTPVSLALQLPPSVQRGSPLLFEIYGRLWQQLQLDDDGVAPRHLELLQYRMGAQWVSLFPLQLSGTGGTIRCAAAVFREQQFTPVEARALVRSLRAMVAVVSGSDDEDSTNRPLVTASVSSRSPEVSAEVTIALDPSGGSTLTGTARARDIVAAIACAAANACRPQCEVLYAASIDLEDLSVTIVIVQETGGAPVLGLSLRPQGDHTGPAEAVFSAIASPPGAVSKAV